MSRPKYYLTTYRYYKWPYNAINVNVLERATVHLEQNIDIFLKAVLPSVETSFAGAINWDLHFQVVSIGPE